MVYLTKTIIFALLLFVLIIGIGFYSISNVSISAKNIENIIADIENEIKYGNWDKAKNELLNLDKKWLGTEKIWTILLDHFEIDNIDASIAKLEKYIDSNDKPLALGESANLLQYIKHIPEKEMLSLKNIM